MTSDASRSLWLGWSRRQPVAAHDFHHLCSVRRTTCRRVDHLGRFAKKLRTYRGWSNRADRLHILASIVIEPVNGSARNAERLPRPNVDLLSVDSPGQHSGDSIDRLFVVVVAMPWSC